MSLQLAVLVPLALIGVIGARHAVKSVAIIAAIAAVVIFGLDWLQNQLWFADVPACRPNQPLDGQTCRIADPAPAGTFGYAMLICFAGAGVGVLIRRRPH